VVQELEQMPEVEVEPEVLEKVELLLVPILYLL
jgi:hypothetical protein